MATKSLPSHCSKRVCLCSPTNHPGSFRCSLHRSSGKVSSKSVASAPYVNRQKEDQSKSAMMMMMMSTVSSSSSKSSLIKAFLMQIISPSSHGLQRRRNFHPKPSRFSSLHSSANGVAVS
ncbi:Detected protein of unknown function [Hibiscus syriacus]|uniref:Serine-rich protein-related n=1 Tax=Hibiscus syriacus TaxID=106335 RepID=A0A6A2WFB1_HIBSY|nr:uncharacterized protein LOC120194179 [Hibiscus syriacus]KAE8656938.1 Detected protein of unknown function [Hibiscus syriacus]